MQCKINMKFQICFNPTIKIFTPARILSHCKPPEKLKRKHNLLQSRIVLQAARGDNKLYPFGIMVLKNKFQLLWHLKLSQIHNQPSSKLDATTMPKRSLLQAVQDSVAFMLAPNAGIVAGWRQRRTTVQYTLVHFVQFLSGLVRSATFYFSIALNLIWFKHCSYVKS